MTEARDVDVGAGNCERCYQARGEIAMMLQDIGGVYYDEGNEAQSFYDAQKILDMLGEAGWIHG
jgi:hypothetical protein